MLSAITKVQLDSFCKFQNAITVTLFLLLLHAVGNQFSALFNGYSYKRSGLERTEILKVQRGKVRQGYLDTKRPKYLRF
jgi:hypothetical protein